MRLRNAEPSSSDSISAPRAAGMPRSVQKATICVIGMAMATQQPTMARQMRSCTRLPLRPSTRSPFCGSRKPGRTAEAGGRWRRKKQSGTIRPMASSPHQNIVTRQP